jgi:hypothetical protein
MRSGRGGQDKNLFPLPEIEPLFPDSPAFRLITVLTDLSRLLELLTTQ